METETQGLKDAAEQALVSLIQSVADAASFLKGEIPIAVRELLTYYTALYVLYVVCAVVLATGIGLAIRKISRLEDWDTDDKVFACGIICIVPAIGVVWLSSHVIDLLKITLAPRIWLIEYAASLVK
jgi:hypothetical protein